jgi:hypothetical protein
MSIVLGQWRVSLTHHASTSVISRIPTNRFEKELTKHSCSSRRHALIRYTFSSTWKVLFSVPVVKWILLLLLRLVCYCCAAFSCFFSPEAYISLARLITSKIVGILSFQHLWFFLHYNAQRTITILSYHLFIVGCTLIKHRHLMTPNMWLKRKLPLSSQKWNIETLTWFFCCEII